jgi:hypothetical protein
VSGRSEQPRRTLAARPVSFPGADGTGGLPFEVPPSFEATQRWIAEESTALQRAVEEAFADAVHEFVRPYVDPSCQALTGMVPVVDDLEDVPPPVVSEPSLELDLDEETRLIARATPSRRELRRRQRERERSRVVLARKLATGGVLAVAAMGTVAVAGPKVLAQLGKGGSLDVIAGRLTSGATSGPNDSGANGSGLPPSGPDESDLLGPGDHPFRGAVVAQQARKANEAEVSAAARSAGVMVATLVQAQHDAEVAAADKKKAADQASRKAEQQRVADAAARASRGSGGRSDPPKSIAASMLPKYGWADSQFGCLDLLWTRESNWNYRATNPSSGAYGIPQALPGSKMATVASDWRTNPVTQITWGLIYIKDVYGSPCGAWSHSQATGWY